MRKVRRIIMENLNLINEDFIMQAVDNLYYGKICLTSDYLFHLMNILKITEQDSEIDILFKLYIQNGNQKNTVKAIKERSDIEWLYDSNRLSDILFYNYSSNLEVTILAKVLYYKNTKYDFAIEQANALMASKDLSTLKKLIQDYRDNASKPHKEIYLGEEVTVTSLPRLNRNHLKRNPLYKKTNLKNM